MRVVFPYLFRNHAEVMPTTVVQTFLLSAVGATSVSAFRLVDTDMALSAGDIDGGWGLGLWDDFDFFHKVNLGF
jgi:hypothetical protein